MDKLKVLKQLIAVLEDKNYRLSDRMSLKYLRNVGVNISLEKRLI